MLIGAGDQVVEGDGDGDRQGLAEPGRYPHARGEQDGKAKGDIEEQLEATLPLHHAAGGDAGGQAGHAGAQDLEQRDRRLPLGIEEQRESRRRDRRLEQAEGHAHRRRQPQSAKERLALTFRLEL